MALSSATNKSGPYDCNGSVTEFSGTFRILAEADIRVVLTDSSENDQDLVLTTDYTVTPAGGSYPADTFTVTTVSTYDSGNNITIVRNMDFKQETDYGNSGPYLPENHETSFDKLTMMCQELKEEMDRSVKFGPGVDITGVSIVIDSGGSVIISYLQDGSVSTAKIADDAVTFDKIQNIATNTVLGRSTAGTGSVEALTCTSAGRALLDDASATAQRTTLGLGDSATKNVGTTAGTVAAGDDSRFTDERHEVDLLHVQAVYASGSDGSAAGSSGAWDKADLNTVVVNNISGATLSSSVISGLPAGDYQIEGWLSMAGDDGRAEFRGRVYDTNGSSTLANGANTFEDSAGAGPATFIPVSGRATLAGSETIELQGWWSNEINVSAVTFGRSVSSGDSEVYADLKIRKV